MQDSCLGARSGLSGLGEQSQAAVGTWFRSELMRRSTGLTLAESSPALFEMVEPTSEMFLVSLMNSMCLSGPFRKSGAKQTEIARV